jgi:uncharacterized protein YchJ
VPGWGSLDDVIEGCLQMMWDEGPGEPHSERAEFVRFEGRRAFVDGDCGKPETFHRDAPGVGRNDPCARGSGKKHEKCCGA